MWGGSNLPTIASYIWKYLPSLAIAIGLFNLLSTSLKLQTTQQRVVIVSFNVRDLITD